MTGSKRSGNLWQLLVIFLHLHVSHYSMAFYFACEEIQNSSVIFPMSGLSFCRRLRFLSFQHLFSNNQPSNAGKTEYSICGALSLKLALPSCATLDKVSPFNIDIYQLIYQLAQTCFCYIWFVLAELDLQRRIQREGAFDNQLTKLANSWILWSFQCFFLRANVLHMQCLA